MVTVVWETWLKKGNGDEGLKITRQIWSDMQKFKGYISHSILVDKDNKEHLLVFSKWENRALADRIKDEYANAETVKLITTILECPRGRWIFEEDTIINE
ncbi:antibiotic biosynthesis monooxygenase family protein [Clostridium sp. JS66]|uniref:antibiotic biosynthesis monooxygenase family protein n=1 Tax=Clostridium sp. JS66 TaxID=3064705 RepID=UPI00298D63FF|nr:antibiotic biosynthesis monooxygenase [Clostridium sp. JS66]WPC42665.1 antibiotic biosynthesis monooxygenase [Clostridium sp. JS66]